MDQRTIRILFSLLRSAIRGIDLTEEEKSGCSPKLLYDLFKISAGQDITHLVALGLKQNHLLTAEKSALEKPIFKAAYRHEQLKHEYDNLCSALEGAEIPFLPLKGSVLRNYYPEPWMRTSCDIDILVHREDLDRAIAYLVENLKYVEGERATHDVSFFSPTGVHVELHFDLVEEGRANNAIGVLSTVWENVHLREGNLYHYEMSDAFFYFYHIAHMAKHFETGGCGIRPFIDLWILDHMESVDISARNELLTKGGLMKFAEVSRALSEVWLGERAADEVLLQMQDFLLRGGVYGSTDNRVALQQKRKGGRFGYIISRLFVPYEKLKRYYPILEKHRWLTPFMQIRRWFMLLRPDVAKMAKREMKVNSKLDKSKADETGDLLESIGLDKDGCS